MLHFFFLLLAPLVQRVCGSWEQFSLLIDWGLSFILIHITGNCCLAIYRHALLCQSLQEPAVWWRLIFVQLPDGVSQEQSLHSGPVWTQRESPSGRVCFLQQTVSYISQYTISPLFTLSSFIIFSVLFLASHSLDLYSSMSILTQMNIPACAAIIRAENFIY